MLRGRVLRGRVLRGRVLRGRVEPRCAVYWWVEYGRVLCGRALYREWFSLCAGLPRELRNLGIIKRGLGDHGKLDDLREFLCICNY